VIDRGCIRERKTNSAMEKKLKAHRDWLKLALMLGLLIVLAAGCGPKGFIKATVYCDGQLLANQEILVTISGRTRTVATSATGTFEISGIALGPQQISVSFQDPKTKLNYKWEKSVQVGIQGVKLDITFTGALTTFDELLKAARIQMIQGQWEAAGRYLDDLERHALDPIQAQSLKIAWGWFYLHSQGDDARAQDYFEQAMALGATGLAQVGLAGVKALQGRYEMAITDLEQALQREPYLELAYPDLDTGDLYVVLATWYLQVGDKDRAVAILENQNQGTSMVGQNVKNAVLTAIGS